MEEQRELATNRLAELEKLQKDHQKALKDIEQLKLDVSSMGHASTRVANRRGDCAISHTDFRTLHDSS